MTNLEAKQEAIKKAYGEYWETVKDYVDGNGWCSARRSIGFEKIISKLSWQTKVGNQYLWRPSSLQGIENNNGWIHIESDEDLPKNDMHVRITFNKKVNIAFLCNGEFYNPNKVKYHKKGVTHYKPIEETNSPIF